MHIVFQLSSPATPRLLAETRRVLHGYLEIVGIDPEVIAEVVLAVDEACANVIRHAASGPEDEYVLRADLTPERIAISVDDSGPGFDPDAVRLPDREATSGRGLQIIREFMSSVDIDHTPPRGTRLRMERTLP
ncbi:MAG: ATP-binding protein [Acidimicrobiales bacterium]